MTGSLGVNRVTIVGELARDPEMRYLPDGGAVTSLSVATRQRFTVSDGASREADERFQVLAWGELAQQARLLKQGEQVYVEGRLQTRSWQDEAGARHFLAEVVAGEMVVLGSVNPTAAGSGRSAEGAK